MRYPPFKLPRLHFNVTSWHRLIKLQSQTPTVLIAALLTAVVASLAVESIHGVATNRRQAVVILKTVEGLAHRLSALEWQTAAEGTLTPSLIQQVDEAHRAFEESLTQLAQVQVSSSSAEVIQASQHFGRDIEQLFQLYEAGAFDEAEEWDEEHVDPSYEQLLEVTSEASLLYAQEATMADAYARIGSIFIMVTAATLISALFWRFQRARRSIDRLAVEQQIIRTSERRFRSLISNATDVIVICDADGTMREPSPATEQILGRSPATLNGKNIHELVHPEDYAQLQQVFVQALSNPATNIASEVRLQHIDDSWRDCEVIINNRLNDPSVGGIITTCRNITERKRFEDELTRVAFYDSLTHLPNRALFMTRLQHALARTTRTLEPVALLFLDLDNFKLINDSLGHQVGDQLLVAVATRLQSCVRPMDTIARLGGDEFTILLEDIRDVSCAIDVVERIYKALQMPFNISGHEIFTGTSIGIALSTSDHQYPNDLLRDADLAMYRAKNNGKAHYSLFDQSLSDHAQKRLELETDLRYALARGEFQLHYQPIVDLATGKITEMEALIRWLHPQHGLIAPTHFISVAEETGLILPIGEWVLTEACRQVVQWQADYPNDQPLVISVNLSARQFQDPKLIEIISCTLEKTRLKPRCLKLEITESMMIQDSENTVSIIRNLKRLGVQLAIDDFGTGYCSLNYLKRFPVDTLKIDRSFISGLGQNPEDTAIVRAVIAFAKALALSITSEGVETSDQVRQLTTLECDRGQGYYFSKPLSCEGATRLLTGVTTWN